MVGWCPREPRLGLLFFSKSQERVQTEELGDGWQCRSPFVNRCWLSTCPQTHL